MLLDSIQFSSEVLLAYQYVRATRFLIRFDVSQMENWHREPTINVRLALVLFAKKWIFPLLSAERLGLGDGCDESCGALHTHVHRAQHKRTHTHARSTFLAVEESKVDNGRVYTLALCVRRGYHMSDDVSLGWDSLVHVRTPRYAAHDLYTRGEKKKERERLSTIGVKYSECFCTMLESSSIRAFNSSRWTEMCFVLNITQKHQIVFHFIRYKQRIEYYPGVSYHLLFNMVR